MMRGGKEEEKTMGPLFPRLHVNDADKGGPRAPPRNKMALYEQLSIPLQRFNPAAASTLPLPPFNAGNSIPSASFSQGGVHERSVFSPFYMPQSPANSTEVVQTPSDGANLSSGGKEFGRRITRYTNHRSSSAVRPVAECSSLRPLDSSSAKASGEKVDDDDFRVPMFVHSGSAQSNKNRLVMEETRSTPLRAKGPQESRYTALNYSINYPDAYDKPLEQSNIDNRSRFQEKDYIRPVSKDTVVFKEHMQKYAPNLETGEEPAETSNFLKASSNKKNINSNIVIEKACHRSTRVCQESSTHDVKDKLHCLNATELSAKEDDLRVGSESCSKGLFSNNNGCPNAAGNYNGGNDDKTSGSINLKDMDRNDDVSETSMVDSLSGLEISPDDVVGIIGPKQFWKARRAIVNQQRVFAVQVFELHRLIKVQKLIAASPHLLLEDDPYLSGTSQNVPDKNLPPESSSKPQSQIGKQKDDSQKLNQSEECHKDNTRAPIPSREDVLNEGLNHLPRYGPYSGSLQLQVPMAPESTPTPWSYPPANQWLVPVMSPSEGLIYKPYAGPCPPGAGFMAPVYGSYGPTGLPTVAGDFMNTAYGVPAAHQPHNMAVLSGAPAIPSNYFPTPYGVPAMNPNTSTSIVEQISPMTGSRPKAPIEQRSRSSCNMEIPRRDVMSAGPLKLRASKGSELQGSTASSPCERALGEAKDALPLFPIAPVIDGSAQPPESYGRDHQARVIKVVPHNARSATESAARIFRSIQEERQQNDL